MNNRENKEGTHRIGNAALRHCGQFLRIIARRKKALFEQYNIKELGIYGSYARGEQRLRSDVDILVEFEEVPGLLEFIRLETYLSELLQKKVDLVHKKALQPQIRDIILNEVRYV